MAVARVVLASPARRWLAAGLLAACASATTAAPLFFSGRLDDPGNTALVASDLGPAQFGTLQEVANNVAIHAFSITTSGFYDVVSSGVAAGGFDPYVTIFSGTGPGATFLDSNDVNAFSAGGDFTLSLLLAAGDYTLAVGAFANLSFAENLGFGSLGDGFTGLGDPNSLDDGPYRITIDVGDAPQPTPEPPLLPLCALAFAGMAVMRRRRLRHVPQPSLKTSLRAQVTGPRHPWFAPLAAAMLATGAGPVFAQRAVLVQNVDDSSRVPYQEAASSSCVAAVACSATFSPVPAGRRRIVENVSCRASGSQITALTLATPGPVIRMERVFLPITPVAGQPGFVVSNLATQAYFEAGEVPVMYMGSSGSASLLNVFCTLTGREIPIP